jgi:hypothetical protein
LEDPAMILCFEVMDFFFLLEANLCFVVAMRHAQSPMSQQAHRKIVQIT